MPTYLHLAPCAFNAVVRGGIPALRRVAAFLARARRAACARAELRRLDAAALRDLGLSSSDLASLVACADGHSSDSGWRAR